MEKFNVIIKGDNIPITLKQWEIVQEAGKMIHDSGLTYLITEFYIDGLKEDNK